MKIHSFLNKEKRLADDHFGKLNVCVKLRYLRTYKICCLFRWSFAFNFLYTYSFFTETKLNLLILVVWYWRYVHGDTIVIIKRVFGRFFRSCFNKKHIVMCNWLHDYLRVFQKQIMNPKKTFFKKRQCSRFIEATVLKLWWDVLS